MEETTGNDLEVKTSGASTVAALSQSDDIVIADSSSSTLTDDRSSGPGNENSFEKLGTCELDADNAVDMHTSEEMPTLLKTPEPEKPGKKFNLRKSLAWDSAFFTSDGVLDAEELSTMMGGGEKGNKHQLPGIEEEVYRSMESISTLESDNLSLECLEAELFEDIRASIQKSSRASNLNNSSIKVSSAKRDSQVKVSSSSKKMDFDSGKRPAVRIKDNTSSIPQPKIINKVNSTSILTKRASLSTNQAKKDQDIAKQAHVTQKGTQPAKTTTQASKITGVIGPRRGVPKPSLSSKSSLGSSTALKSEPTRPSSSCSNSSSSSGNDVKHAASFLRRKVDSKTSKLTAGSISKTPSKIGMKKKATPVNASLSSNFSNLPSNISPASSVSGWSSESSSSTSTINRKSTSRGSIDTSVSHRSFDGDASIESASTINPTSRNSNQNGNHAVVMPPSQTASLSRPPVVQPTGLRMPSPKIGFFDGGKSGVRTPNGMRSQSRLPTAVPRTGATHSSPATSDAAKFGKLPPSKTTATHTSMKPNPQKTVSKPFQERPSAKPKIPTTSQAVKSSLLTSDHKGTQESEEFKTVSAEDSVIEQQSLNNICLNSSNIVDNDTNKQSHSGNKLSSKSEETHEGGKVEIPNTNSASEAPSNGCSVSVKDNKLDKTITDGSRTPFALKNSVCDAIETGMEVPEKSVSFLFVESQQHKENSEVI